MKSKFLVSVMLFVFFSPMVFAGERELVFDDGCSRRPVLNVRVIDKDEIVTYEGDVEYKVKVPCEKEVIHKTWVPYWDEEIFFERVKKRVFLGREPDYCTWERVCCCGEILWKEVRHRGRPLYGYCDFDVERRRNVKKYREVETPVTITCYKEVTEKRSLRWSERKDVVIDDCLK